MYKSFQEVLQDPRLATDKGVGAVLADLWIAYANAKADAERMKTLEAQDATEEPAGL